MEDRGSETYESVVLDGWPAKTQSNRPDGSYATKDLFIRHPQNKDWFKYVGRLDDTLVQVLGEKTNPGKHPPWVAIVAHNHNVVQFPLNSLSRATAHTWSSVSSLAQVGPRSAACCFHQSSRRTSTRIARHSWRRCGLSSKRPMRKRRPIPGFCQKWYISSSKLSCLGFHPRSNTDFSADTVPRFLRLRS